MYHEVTLRIIISKWRQSCFLKFSSSLTAAGLFNSFLITLILLVIDLHVLVLIIFFFGQVLMKVLSNIEACVLVGGCVLAVDLLTAVHEASERTAIPLQSNLISKLGAEPERNLSGGKNNTKFFLFTLFLVFSAKK